MARRRHHRLAARLAGFAGLIGLAAATACSPLAVGYDTSQIVKVGEATVSGYRAEYYENHAYTCGVSGYHTFVVAYPVGVPASDGHPLWVRMHGGGLGAFDATSTYLPPDMYPASLDQESFAELGSHAQGSGLMALVRAHPAGFRILVPSMCDHDGYSGNGGIDPNNPHSPDENGATRATDGLQATKAAVAWTREQYATTATFVHGTSAGSYGAFYVAYALELHGVPAQGAILDSGVRSDIYIPAFWEYRLTTGDCGGVTDEPSPDLMAARLAHISDEVWDPADLVGRDRITTPLAHMWDRRDPNVCRDTPIPYTDENGQLQQMDSADFNHEALRAAIEADPPAGVSVNLRVCVGGTDVTNCGTHSPTKYDAVDRDTGLDYNQYILDWVDALLP